MKKYTKSVIVSLVAAAALLAGCAATGPSEDRSPDDVPDVYEAVRDVPSMSAEQICERVLDWPDYTLGRLDVTVQTSGRQHACMTADVTGRYEATGAGGAEEVGYILNVEVADGRYRVTARDFRFTEVLAMKVNAGLGADDRRRLFFQLDPTIDGLHRHVTSSASASRPMGR